MQVQPTDTAQCRGNPWGNPWGSTITPHLHSRGPGGGGGGGGGGGIPGEARLTRPVNLRALLLIANLNNYSHVCTRMYGNEFITHDPAKPTKALI